MPDRLVVELDPESRALVVEALRADSTRRQRAATRAAAELHREREGGRKDIRSGAVMVTNLLVDAARLDDAALAIERAAMTVTPIPTGSAAWPAPVVDLGELREERQAAREHHPSAPPPPTEEPKVRSHADALADTRKVIEELGLTISPTDDDEDDLDDGRLPEDDPGAVSLPAELADLAPAPQEA